ncbi:ThuA domain-containing protein [Fulvivirga ligni]|uniref:ThuA domain-containing protein n=1 Tax=Fulvivirga ligni TaxID=2904246 RepID=UPI001F3060A7|nr:ThuA domain-containing protein [Fulvivirga ligni]UII24317.1 ThuA domain-containing protein [Fulvivirga ligni]
MKTIRSGNWINNSIIMLLLIFSVGCQQEQARKKPAVLIFSKTEGYRHQSIPKGIETIEKLAQSMGYETVATEDAGLIFEDTLKEFSAVVFLSTSGDVLNDVQQVDLQRFIQAGGGFLGVHGASTTEYNWPWYEHLIGGYFKDHPEVQKATVKKVSGQSILPDSIPDQWSVTDEWYNFKSQDSTIKILLTLDESSYKGGSMGKDHPITWYHEYDGGRAFYTALGHTDEEFNNKEFKAILAAGLEYAVGNEKLDYKQVSSPRKPEDNRFSKRVLDFNLYEPTELAVLPDNRVMFVQRRGEVKLYKPGHDGTKQIAKLDVYHENEDGLMGLGVDPNFAKNHWIYMYYSPAGSEAVNRLSRFTMKGDEILFDTEKIMLSIPVQREECCHTGGSIAFGPDGNLFLSTGDNSNPFDSEGFNPIDEREGRSAWDAQKSSANTNDLRGKILRIHPEDDGTYTIPEGNLFPKGTPKTRPEIYVMGNRNPYRIAVDQKNGTLYWGEVGPDAGETDSLRGPRGHDEINRAPKAGFYGWPYFVGDNKPYRHYDFTTQEPNAFFDVNHPVNTSPNNTGLKDLPPAQPALIWYPYAASPEFPIVGSGGRNAMAGTVYYSDLYKDSPYKFPDYYDDKLIIYDWIRNWVLAVTLNEKGEIVSIEQLLTNMKFSNMMDMAFSDDGVMYCLEYGKGWFQQNIDARLCRIDYNAGNRRPIIEVSEGASVGRAPLTVDFSAKESYDPDRDPIKFKWLVNNQKRADGPDFKYTFEEPGEYFVNLIVTDDNGGYSEEKRLVSVGNEPPKVEIDIAGNSSFFWPGRNVKYTVKVSDFEDGSTDNTIASSEVRVRRNYLEKGLDFTEVSQGHQLPATADLGESLISDSDCSSCHKVDGESIGPSFKRVAEKYKEDPGATTYLANKIIKGGGGVWGEQAMSAHPSLDPDDVAKMVKYVMSLSSSKPKEPGLPLVGTFKTSDPKPDNHEAMYILSASYVDKGADVGRLQTVEQVILRDVQMEAGHYSEAHEVSEFSQSNGNVIISNIKNGSYLRYDNIDFTDVNSLSLHMDFRNSSLVGGNVQVRLDALDGEVIGEGPFQGENWEVINVPLNKSTGKHNFYLIFTNTQGNDEILGFLDWIEFNIDKN